jgi:hypothetical protein
MDLHPELSSGVRIRSRSEKLENHGVDFGSLQFSVIPVTDTRVHTKSTTLSIPYEPDMSSSSEFSIPPDEVLGSGDEDLEEMDYEQRRELTIR